jgi:hypothetical protein
MIKKYVKVSLFLCIGILAANGCSTGRIEQLPDSDEALLISTPTEDSKPTAEEPIEFENKVPKISNQPYVSQSNAYTINLPEGWNCSETGEFQVNCQSVDQSAELSARITATGYEFDQKAFLSFTHAELVHAYSEVKEYIEIERQEEMGRLKTVATWRVGEVYWLSTDWFLKKNGTVFQLSTLEHKSLNGKHADLFNSIRESIKVTPAALQGAQLYANRVIHTAPQAFFEVEIPTAWGRYSDSGTVENTIIEGFTSPDQRAAVQIAVYNRGSLIGQKLKAEKTLDIMRAQYGYDLRVSHDKALPDGRERLAWYADRKGINGISYFDSYDSSLYVFSIVWEEPTGYIYQAILEEISESFKRE